MTQTVAYYRSSTELQEDSVSTQEFYAMQYCSEKMLLIDKEISDEFVSAKLTPLKNRKFNQILDGIKKGEFNTLIIYKRDRLARNLIEYMEIYSILKKYNVEVHFTTSHEAPMRYDETGEFYEVIMAGLCQHEGEQIKLRISEGRSASFEQGKHKGILPYGYLVDKDSGKIYVPPEAKKDILFIYSELLSENHATLNDLKLYLKKHHIQRLRLKESKKFNPEWGVKAIEDMISNTMYMGIRQMNFKGKLHTYTSKDYALLSVEKWYRAQEILKDIKSKKSRSKRPIGSFLLENFIRCHECKQPLTPIMRMRKKVWVGVYECKSHKVKLLSDEVESEILDKCCCHFFSLLSEYGEDFYNKFFSENVNKIKMLTNRIDQIINLFNTQIIHNVSRLMGTNNVFEKTRLENKLVTLELKLKHVKGKKEQLHLTIEQLKQLPEQISSFKDKTKFTDALKNLSHNERLILLNNIIMSAYASHEGIKLFLKHPIKGSEEIFIEYS
ncbi:hypothetical protein BSK48_05200 [Paenibacillus odorifer]|uniref:recombinase family protein n=1 Tax=Paenibacillus odorifer TaxID=189426 RepID=UPI00096F31D2|nr:recombinase family protein [Paenibacillus odorifer]OMD73267.1 hypothetical protein BSK48_05200 [Paenibacillus odorifer]